MTGSPATEVPPARQDVVDVVPTAAVDVAAEPTAQGPAAVGATAEPERDHAIPDDAEVSRETLPADLWESAVPDSVRGNDGRRAESHAQAAEAPARRSSSRGSRRSSKPEPTLDGLALPEDANDAVKDTMAALRSLFPGRPISVEPPDDGAEDGEADQIGAALDAGDLPADPDAAERDLDEDGATLPRRAAHPVDGVT